MDCRARSTSANGGCNGPIVGQQAKGTGPRGFIALFSSIFRSKRGSPFADELMRRSSIRARVKSARALRRLHKKRNLWKDSSSDRSSLSEDDGPTARDRVDAASNGVCFVCLLAPSLSRVTCCREHLALFPNTRATMGASKVSSNGERRSRLRPQHRLKPYQRFHSSRLLSSVSSSSASPFQGSYHAHRRHRTQSVSVRHRSNGRANHLKIL